jgi:hypothetical protein
MASPPSQRGAPRVSPTRQDTFAVEVFLNGNSMGIWDKKTCGELDSEDTKYYPGAMEEAISLGGRVTPANVVCQRLYDRALDHDNIAAWFDQVGSGNIKIYQRPMDFDKNRYGQAVQWVGTLKRVAVPDVDSESSTAALMEIEATIATRPTSIGSP